MPGSAEVDWARYVAVKVQWIYNALTVALQRGCCRSRASTICQPNPAPLLPRCRLDKTKFIMLGGGLFSVRACETMRYVWRGF